MIPQVGFYGDDFTGSVDALLQFRTAGLSGVLVTSADALSQGAGTSAYDVVGVAGIARSLGTAQIDQEVRPVLQRFADQGVPVVQYKACSTVDSSPDIGSLGRAIEIGRDIFGDVPVPVIFAQPDFGRYTVFGHHFAQDGDQVFRLDRQPTMMRHPVTPATESDLRRHLAFQTRLPIGAVHWPEYADPDDLAAVLSQTSDAAILCDGLTNDQLMLLGQAILRDQRRPRFVLGSGGLSLGLGAALQPTATLPELSTDPTPARGPTVVLSGSTSPKTRQQINAATSAGFVELNLFDADTAECGSRLHNAGSPVMISSTAAAPPRSVSTEEIATRLATLGDALLRQAPNTRLIICGGDTSGAVLRRLGIETLLITRRPWGNVALCTAQGAAPHLREIDVVLKGGQMGHLDLFDDVRRGHPQPTSHERP